MKRKVRWIGFVALVMVALFGVVNAGASPIRTPVTAWEIPVCPDHAACTAGVWTFPGGNMHVRDWVQVYNAIGLDDDRLNGTNTLVANANFDANGTGPGWGTFHNEVANYDGYWAGTFAAMMSPDGYVSHIVGQGYGELEGLMIHATEVNGYFEGVITELPGN